MIISKKLKEMRHILGLSQSEFSKKLKIPPATYSSWENGRRYPMAVNIRKIAKFANANNIKFSYEDYLDG